jgi:hypothetical protein
MMANTTRCEIPWLGFCGANIADAYDKPMRNRYLRVSFVLKAQSLFVVKLFHAVSVVFLGEVNVINMSLRRICLLEVPKT